MKSNIGTVDKTVRIIAALLMGILIVTGHITGVASIVFSVLAFVFVVTGFISFCPLYTIAGLSTVKKKT